MATSTSIAATAAGTSRTFSMKLLIDTKTQRVLFAEATKEVVDFLFSLLALPIATAAKLIGQESVAGSVGNLYASVDKLDSTYILPGAAKDALLRPTAASAVAATGRSLLRLPSPSPVPPKFLYRCMYKYTNCYYYVTDVSGTTCPSCGKQMNMAVYLYNAQRVQSAAAAGAPGPGAKGLVQGVVTYTVTDDLDVTPMSTISGIALLNTFAVSDLSDLQEKTVQIGYDEGVEILKASLQSKTVLTDVFLGNKAPGGACVVDMKHGKAS
ncbi:hypothetical protein EJB05_31524, partial [Eragrostis curvula]